MLLFQLPPNLAVDLPRLEAFLEGLPDHVPAAFVPLATREHKKRRPPEGGRLKVSLRAG